LVPEKGKKLGDEDVEGTVEVVRVENLGRIFTIFLQRAKGALTYCVWRERM
jgi:hypothetical protein